MPQHPHNPKVTIKCPCCGTDNVVKGRNSYVEIGEYDEISEECEEEMEVTEYDCRKCLTTFFL